MAKNLLIVESPAKSKTIGGFLGKDYEVLSSFGHIRDLKTKGMGIDMDNNFAPQYEVSEDKEKVVDNLRKAAKKADKVWLASDEDREGEAIAWHLAEELGLDQTEKNRIVFHEITKSAIQDALQNPRSIDLQMVDAQQARRVLDRIVGFELSPILWRKIRPSLSAGRVQSVAVRIIVERERAINDFTPESSFRIQGEFLTPKSEAFSAEVSSRPKTQEEAQQLLESLKDNNYTVGNVDVKPITRKPAAPFTTSTLQQEASRRLGYSVGETMRLAQGLYEAGHITYMRTDSVNLSKFAIGSTCSEVEKEFGKEYVHARNFSTHTKGAQEAHEAIRPTNISVLTAGNNVRERKLYDLIRKRTLATQMAEAQLERTQVDINSDSGTTFVAKGEVIKFEGFLKVYLEGTDDESDNDSQTKLLPKLTTGETITPEVITATERFNQRPPRYTEASLVKKMEELGIGRPSTYAPTIQTIQKREYIEKRSTDGEKREYMQMKLKNNKVTTRTRTETYGMDRNKLFPTDTGLVVTDFLVENFPKVLDYNFTAEVEEEFDNIAEGKKEWTSVIATFYALFHDNVEKVMSEKSEHRIGERELGVDPKSGDPVFAKIGRYGPMIQIGKAEEGSPKPRFSSVPKDKSIETITLEEALRLFDLPRELGEYDGDTIIVNIGRFGPYVKFGKLYASIPRDQSPYKITLEEAIPLINNKKEQERKKHIATFGSGDDEIQVLNGRYGPYIKHKGKNYKIPKSQDATKLTESEAKAIIEAGGNTAAPKRKKAASKTTKTSRKKQ